MNPNFGSIFGVPLINDRVTTYDYTPPPEKQMKALMVSDCHIGATKDPFLSIEGFISSLKTLIEKENPTVLFILGDLVDGTQTEDVYEKTLKEVDKIGIPTYVIGGNHDRKFIPMIEPNFVNTVVTEALAIQLSAKLPGKPETKIFLAHDLLNNYRVRDQHAFFFADWIKRGCRRFIKPADWLIIGHTHTAFISNTSRISCVGQFSPEINVYSYATLEFNSDLVLSLSDLVKPIA